MSIFAAFSLLVTLTAGAFVVLSTLDLAVIVGRAIGRKLSQWWHSTDFPYPDDAH